MKRLIRRRTIFHGGFLKSHLWIFWLFTVWVAAWNPVSESDAAEATDDFIQGYVTAILAMSYPGQVGSIQVKNGEVYVEKSRLSEEEKTNLSQAISDIKGVKKVQFLLNEKYPQKVLAAETGKEKTVSLDGSLPVFLPETQLFRPLIAAPRWPRFSASYQRYTKGDLLTDVASVSFGESFSIYRFHGPWQSIMEVGIQAGVFSIFDLDAESFDLINADYRVGIPVSIKKGNFTNMTRIFHQSSHLGDEYVLRGNAAERKNLSYNAFDTLFSYDFPKGLRAYVGGGYLFDRTPSDFEPWYTQVGLEFHSPWSWLNGALSPVAAADIQNWQESGWNTDLSVRAGIQFENPKILGRKLMLLLEYYNGKSPNGQFYESTIEYFGLGLHFFFQ